MRMVGNLLASLGIVGSALLGPVLYLHSRAADPQGIADGLLRLSWAMPILWPVGVYLETEGRLGRAKGLLKLQLPLLVGLTAATTFAFGWLNDGKTLVDDPAPLTRAQEVALASGKPVYQETSLGPLDGVGQWCHAHLPAGPFNRR